MAEQNNNPVEVLSTEPSVRNQYGKGFVYANTRKHPIWMLVTGIVLSTALIFPLFIGGPPKREDIEGIATPNLDGARSSNVNIPFYSAEQAQADKEHQTRKSKSKIAIRYPGIQSIDRELAFEIPPGAEAKAKIVGPASDGTVRAELTEDLRADGKTFFRSGTLFTGQAASNDDRLQISFSTVTLQGKRFPIQAQALDMDDKSIGIRGSRFGYYSKKLGVAIGLNFVAGVTEVLQDRDSVGTNVIKKPTLQNALLNGTSQTASDLSKAEMEKAKKGSEVIRLNAGTEIVIVF